MKRLLFFLLLAAVAAFGADDPWAKVEALKSGTEIRVMKRGAAQPLVGKMGEADAERLTIVIKKEELAIAKDMVDRVEYRPAGKRVTVSGKTVQEDPAAAKEPRAGMNHEPEGGATTANSSVNLGSKPEFQLLYRRQTGAPKKAEEK